MAPHSSILAWKIPWAVEPGRLVHGLQRVRLHCAWCGPFWVMLLTPPLVCHCGLGCDVLFVKFQRPSHMYLPKSNYIFFFFWAITFQGKGIISKFLPFPPWSGSRVFLWNVSINQNGIKQTHSQTHPANGWTKQTEVKAQLLTDAFQLWQKACGEAWWATPAAGACAAAVTVHRQTLNAALTLCSVS